MWWMALSQWTFHTFQDSIKMSQLQNLLHDALIATENVQQCAIIRRKDNMVRASSVGFNVSALCGARFDWLLGGQFLLTGLYMLKTILLPKIALCLFN